MLREQEIEELLRRANPEPSEDFFRFDPPAAKTRCSSILGNRSDMSAPTDRTMPREARHSGWNAVTAFAAAALVLILIGGVGLISMMGGEGPEPAAPSPTTTLSTTTLPSTTEAPVNTVAAATTTTPATNIVPVTPPGLEITLEQAPTRVAFGLDDSVRSVIRGGPGLVAVGCAADEGLYSDAAVWTSVDGVAWDRVVDLEVFGGIPDDVHGTDGNQVIMDVASGPAGLVAVGWVDTRTGDIDPPIWISPDGLVWSRVMEASDALPPGSSINAIVTGGPGYIAVGSDEVGHAAIWASDDGIAWAGVDRSLGAEHNESQITDIVRTDWGFAAVGFADPEWRHFPTGQALVWTSLDGLTWDQSNLGSEPATVWAIAGSGDAAVAVGSASDDSVAWVSFDTKAWSASLPIVSLDEELWFNSVLWDGDRLLAFASSFPEYPSGEYPFPGSLGAAVWASDDAGTTWYDVTPISNWDEGIFSSTHDQQPPGFKDATAFGDRFLVVGGTGNGSAPVWIGTWNED